MSESWIRAYGSLLPETDLDRLKLFIEHVESMKERRFFQRNSLDVYVEAETSGVSAISDHGDAEDLRSALLDLRKILMKKEVIFIDRIVNSLIRYEDEPDRGENLIKSRESIRQARKESADAVLTTDEQGRFILSPGRTSEELLDEIFNKQLFHTDPKAGGEKLPLPNMRASFSDNNVTEVIDRQNLLAYIFDEFEYAVWVSGFAQSKT